MDEKHNPGTMTRRQFTTWLAAAASCVSLARIGMSQTSGRPLRVAISVETLAGANVNDARAAYQIWSHEIINILGLRRAELIPEAFISSEEIVRMIRQGSIDMFAITAWEYAKVLDRIDSTSILLGEAESEGIEYLLLVHSNSPYKKLSDLRGRQLLVHHHRDMNLLPAWMGNMLSTGNLPRMDAFFSAQTNYGSLTKVVLPVFFRHADVAALARNSFATAVEMNPQLGKSLRILAVSPKVIPIMLCFQKNCSQEGKKYIQEGIIKAESLPTGQQIEALYGSQKTVIRNASCMTATLDMLRQYERITDHAPGTRKEHS
jgi:ABC-type phosphate/phosphonate transport system substrate-binding protein